MTIYSVVKGLLKAIQQREATSVMRLKSVKSKWLNQMFVSTVANHDV